MALSEPQHSPAAVTLTLSLLTQVALIYLAPAPWHTWAAPHVYLTQPFIPGILCKPVYHTGGGAAPRSSSQAPGLDSRGLTAYHHTVSLTYIIFRVILAHFQLE